MDTRKPIKASKKPSTMLGFLLIVVMVLSAVFLAWQLWLDQKSDWRVSPERLLAIMAILSAVVGWIVAAITTLRNSIRQHTITTLLESRLSSTYMGYADTLSTHFEAYERRKSANPTLKDSPTDGIDVRALRYVLNYFEFIAIGVKHGDLDEETLRDSLGGILHKNVMSSRSWINMRRSTNPKAFEHLLWLQERWRVKRAVEGATKANALHWCPLHGRLCDGQISEPRKP